jgi:hypothetical protein
MTHYITFMNNSEDLTLKLPTASEVPDAPNTNPISLDEFYARFREEQENNALFRARFREEQETNALFRDEMRGILALFMEEARLNFGRVFQRLDSIEREQHLMSIEIGKLAAGQSRHDARLVALEDDVALLKAA